MQTLIKNNQITFIDGRFYVAEDGTHYPSVTTILEAYPKTYALIQWLKEVGNKSDEIRDAAGRRGSIVHQLTDDYDRGNEVNLLGESGQPMYSIEEWAMFERYVDFSIRFKPEYSLIEQNIICQELGFGGTVDRVGVIGGKRYLIDIKTSNGIYNGYWLQLAAYRQGVYINLGIEVDGVAIIWLNAKTRTNGKNGDMQGVGWQAILKENTDNDWLLFQAVQKLWLAENENAKPKNFSYHLTHKK
jgi:hypothetical protein